MSESSSQKSEEKYQYRVDEKSLTQNFLTRFLWNPIISQIPSRITPNSITVTGFFFMLLSIPLFWAGLKGHSLGFLGAAFCVFLYMTCDNVDGPHARRTGQSSKLGEFLDHWLDAMDMIIVNMCLIFAFQLDGWLLLVLSASLSLAFFATIWEHHHTGVFHSGRLGTNEGLILIIGLYASFCFIHGYSWVSYQGFEKVSLALVVACFSTLVCLVTIAKTMLRMKSHLTEYIPLVLCIAAICVWAGCGLPKRIAALGILFSNVLFSGPLLVSRLAGKASPYRGWILSMVSLLAILLALIIPSHIALWAKTWEVIYATGFFMAGLAFWDLGRAMKGLIGIKKVG